MRDSCYDCCIKHLAQACVLMEESRHGYYHHQYLALGHLAEASSEIEKYDMVLAERIRKERKMLQSVGNEYAVDFMGLIDEVVKLKEAADVTT